MQCKEIIMPNRQTETRILSKLNRLRGLFAILIVLGHCARRYEIEPLLLKIPHYGAFIWVCFFFMISSWNMAHNFDVRTNYLKSFVTRKVIKLIILTVEMLLFSKVLKYFFLSQPIFLGKTIWNEINWYIYEMIFFYLCFWLVYYTIKDPLSREIIIWIISICLCVCMWKLYRDGKWNGWSFAYYYSALSFPLGITLHRILDLILRKKKFFFFVCAMVACASSICIKMPKESFGGGVILHNALGLCMMILMVVIVSDIEIKDNLVLRFLTNKASYIYLYQFCVMEIFLEIFNYYGKTVNWIYVVLVVTFLFFVSEMVYLINKKIVDFRKGL